MNDQELSALLRTWRAPEPSPTFEQDVLRRVRLAPAAPARMGWLAWFAPAPFWSAIAAAVVAGLIAGVVSKPVPHALLADDSVSRSYVRIVTGGSP